MQQYNVQERTALLNVTPPPPKFQKEVPNNQFFFFFFLYKCLLNNLCCTLVSKRWILQYGFHCGQVDSIIIVEWIVYILSCGLDSVVANFILYAIPLAHFIVQALLCGPHCANFN